MKSFYRCDNKFHLDAIIDMYDLDMNYGIALLSGKEYRCYLVSINIIGTYKEFKFLDGSTVELQRKHNKGGSAANRYLNGIQDKRHLYIKKLAEILKKNYMRKNNTEYLIKGLVIGGPADIKTDVIDTDIFKQYFSKILLKTVSTDEITDSTIHNVYDNCLDIFNIGNTKETKQILSEFKELLDRADQKLVFGIAEVSSALEEFLLEKIIISDVFYKQNKDALNISNKCKLFVVPDHNIKSYGSIIGIKYF